MTVEAPSPPPDHDDLQALIEEARLRARNRRRRNGAAALIVAIAIAAGSLLATEAGGDHGESRVGLVSSSSAPLSVGRGPFWYMRTIGSMRAPLCAKQLPGIMHRCASTVWFDVVTSTETWVGTDGTMRERSVEVSQRFASAAGRARWLASGKPVPIWDAQGDGLEIASGHYPSPALDEVTADLPAVEGPPIGAGPVDVGDGLFGYRQLLALPTSGRAALARIEQAWTGLRERIGEMLLRWHSPGARLVARADLAPSQTAGRSIQELLLISQLDAAPVPTRVRLALLHAAVALPGATVTGGPARTAVAVSWPHWQPESFTFDAHDGELLTGPPYAGGYPDVPGPGSTVVVQGPVDSITALPKGVRPIRGIGAPPLWPSPTAPPAESASPAVADPRSTLTLLVAATPGEHAHPAPTARLEITGSAGEGIYHPGKPAFNQRGVFLPGNQGDDPCLPATPVRVWPATTIRRADQLVYVYRIVPQDLHLQAWCPGRYQLAIQTFPNPLPPHYTTPPYTGPSGTSTYIEVR